MTATVQIRQLSHRFDDFTALSNINLTIEAGSFAVLLGPSGCGKTTLLSVLGGFLQPSEGSVLLNGEDVTHVEPAKRPTTTMFQDYALFPHMTLLDNVGFGLRMRGQSKRERNHRATELLTLVGLEALALKKPHELSGGQRQRVALARALAVDPDVLLLDEPLGALDLKLRQQMQDELKAIQKRVGTTFIHVTHDQEEAMAIANNIIVMNAGQVEDTGSPETIYLAPKTLFSAAFMGEANFLSGRIQTSDGSEIHIETEFGLIVIDKRADVNNNLGIGDAISLCFRPEHLKINQSASEGLLPLGTATITDNAFFGTHQRCQVIASNNKCYTAHLSQLHPALHNTEVSICVERASLVLLRAE